MSVYEYTVKDVNGHDVSLEKYKGDVLLIVNTALDCGFARQYEELELIYREYHDQGFEILDFPCNQFANQSPLEDVENAKACKVRYQTTFETFGKITVNGDDTDPLYQFLKTSKKGVLLPAIKWNFTKFLVDREGNVIERFGPNQRPTSFEDEIKAALA